MYPDKSYEHSSKATSFKLLKMFRTPKDILADTLQEMLEAEKNTTLGYENHDDEN